MLEGGDVEAFSFPEKVMVFNTEGVSRIVIKSNIEDKWEKLDRVDKLIMGNSQRVMRLNFPGARDGIVEVIRQNYISTANTCTPIPNSYLHATERDKHCFDMCILG